MKVHFHATLREVVGGKTFDVPLAENTSVGSLVNRLIERWPPLRHELLEEDGRLARRVHVIVNGRDAPYLQEGLETRLRADDVVDVFPPVGGGAG